MSKSPKGAPEYIDIEVSFDKFVKQFSGASRLDDLYSPAELKRFNADYYFSNENVLIELKALETDQSDESSLSDRFEKAFVHFGVPRSKWDYMLMGVEPMPKLVRKRIYASSQNAMRNALRKANKQLKCSMDLIGSNPRTVAIIANDRDHLFGPVEALKCLAGIALRISDCCIDAIVYTTPNVFYDDGSGLPRQYWAPVYDEGKEDLGDFVNELGAQWLDFTGEVTGDVIEREKVEEFRESDLTARPLPRFGRKKR